MLLGVVPVALLSLAACSGNSSQGSDASSPSDSSMAQMDHGSMGSPSGASPTPASPMPADHSSMMSMDLGPADESFDLRFIDGMTPHHEGAVTMAQEALEKSDRPEIRQLAEEIIAAQEQEISQMKQWRQAWYPNAGEPMMYSAEMGHMMPMTEEMRSGMMMNGDLGAADDQFDLRFMDAMLPHHQGAVAMAEQALEKSDRPEIQALAQNIIDSQQKEITQMQQWKQQWYGQ